MQFSAHSEYLKDNANSFRHRPDVESIVNMLKQLRLLEVLKECNNFNWRGIITRLPYITYKLSIAKNRLRNFEKNYTFQQDVFGVRMLLQD